ncbi:hypothetical protein B0H16DRAFT_1462418 [Mycena metata]|uniref:Uncharacterized protein n=1 Tax=Mycena metata TaxID=1033252 RepID=A0AAD7IMQ6_9AGAR|nr:hypothetical protein B0H16DRAFT_1462418 [Mycena metata]
MCSSQHCIVRVKASVHAKLWMVLLAAIFVLGSDYRGHRLLLDDVVIALNDLRLKFKLDNDVIGLTLENVQLGFADVQLEFALNGGVQDREGGVGKSWSRQIQIQMKTLREWMWDGDGQNKLYGKPCYTHEHCKESLGSETEGRIIHVGYGITSHKIGPLSKPWKICAEEQSKLVQGRDGENIRGDKGRKAVITSYLCMFLADGSRALVARDVAAGKVAGTQRVSTFVLAAISSPEELSFIGGVLNNVGRKWISGWQVM